MSVGGALKLAMCEQRTVWLSVWRKNDECEVVEFEPYSLKDIPRMGRCLVCYHVEHNHLEKLRLDSIRYIERPGDTFEPRWDIEVED